MPIQLWGLHSTNDENGKFVHVMILSDYDDSPTASMDFVICDETKTQACDLETNVTSKVSVEHQQSGTCLVKVTESKSGEYETLRLDLDAERSDGV